MVEEVSFEAVAPRFPCRDLEGAIEYYQSVLGFQPVFINMGGGHSPVFAVLSRDRVELHLASVRNRVMNHKGRFTPGAASCSIRVRDIQSLHDRCEAKGVAVIHADFTSGKHGLKTFTIADPEGNEITFAESD